MSRTFHDPGALNHRMGLESLLETADGIGSLDKQFQPVATVWAALEPKRHDERLLAQQIDEQGSHIITIRFRPDVATGWRFVEGDRSFEIVAITDPDERHRYLQCHTKEVAR
ncbi:phage head closure protein [Ahrensia sp. R2A130]|uniref:phage head closure protein n=1 Tax=Ahrensia sp. R2A130 TaxID=744979 RepID=UPI0001E0E8BF|nr:phage head closure protein [Ahrensia sp. R2A130]EFL88957.1 putative phage head-tail adaptor [Ahrensia sp. R2A130]